MFVRPSAGAVLAASSELRIDGTTLFLDNSAYDGGGQKAERMLPKQSTCKLLKRRLPSSEHHETYRRLTA